MTPSPDPGKARRSTKAILWGALVGACLLFGAGALYFLFSSNPVIAEYWALVRFYSSRREVKAFLARMGPYAPVAFIMIQALQVVVAPIPGEATGFLGGLVFGTTLGFLYSTIGLTLGSLMAFGLGRWLGLPVVRRVISPDIYHKFDFVTRPGAELILLLLFIIPGFPKDYLCFFLGVSPIPFGVFLVICAFGRMPGTWMLSIQGAKVGGGHYLDFLIFLTLTAAIAVSAYIFREKIYTWLRRRHGGDGAGDGPDRMSL
jgi:uncharacterized membrane protein YdjX (TVP38/TMEM64 family)